MRYSFKTSPHETTWPEIRDVWLEAERIPLFEAGWTFDHFYPLTGNSAGPCLEGWITLTALAPLTHRLRLGVMVSSNTYRHPALLANMAATLDVVSEGRLEIGIGAGWNQEEHDAYGMELPPLGERFDRLEEACQVLHLLLTEPVVDFTGRHYKLTSAHCEPKPVQRPRPPLVIGGKGERRTLRIAARWADQWNYPGGSPEELRHKTEVLHRHCADVGRDPAEIEVSVQLRAAADPGETAELAAAYAEAGAGHVSVMLVRPYTPAVLEPTAEALAGVTP